MHPATQQLLHWFEYDHLPPKLQATSQRFAELANFIAEACDGPEATTCLRKLLEAKDCAVRATIGNPMAPEASDK